MLCLFRKIKNFFTAEYEEIKNTYIDINFYTDDNTLLTKDNFYILLIKEEITRYDCQTYINNLPKNERYELLLCTHIYDNYRNKYNKQKLLNLNTHELRFIFYCENTLEANL